MVVCGSVLLMTVELRCLDLVQPGTATKSGSVLVMWRSVTKFGVVWQCEGVFRQGVVVWRSGPPSQSVSIGHSWLPTL